MESTAKHDLEDRLRHNLQNRLLLPGDAEILIAFSGGGDSTALLAAMAALGYAPEAVHVDHGWRPESREWVTHCRAVCESLHIPLRVLTLQPGGSAGEGPEDRARQARYQALGDLLPQAGWLLTAHHLQDQAETFLLQLLRGTGLEGLAAMPWLRPLGQGKLGRPFLDLDREMLHGYCRERGLPWLEDPANADPRFDRARIRHHLLPFLAGLGWPHAAMAIARTAENLADTLDVQRDWLAFHVSTTPGPVPLDTLTHLTPGQQRVYLRQAIRNAGLAVPTRERLEAVRAAVTAGTHGQCIQWPGGQAWLQGGQIRFLHETEGEAWPEGPWDPLRESCPVPGWQAALLPVGTPPPAGPFHDLDAALADQTLQLRRRRGGERYRNAGGRTRPLKKLLLERAIPPARRGTVPLLIDAEGRLLAVLGVTTCGPTPAVGMNGEVLRLWRDETPNSQGGATGKGETAISSGGHP